MEEEYIIKFIKSTITSSKYQVMITYKDYDSLIKYIGQHTHYYMEIGCLGYYASNTLKYHFIFSIQVKK